MVVNKSFQFNRKGLNKNVFQGRDEVAFAFGAVIGLALKNPNNGVDADIAKAIEEKEWDELTLAFQKPNDFKSKGVLITGGVEFLNIELDRREITAAKILSYLNILQTLGGVKLKAMPTNEMLAPIINTVDVPVDAVLHILKENGVKRHVINEKEGLCGYDEYTKTGMAILDAAGVTKDLEKMPRPQAKATSVSGPKA